MRELLVLPLILARVPVTAADSRPLIERAETALRIGGLVKALRSFTAEELRTLPAAVAEVAFHGPRGEEKGRYVGPLLWTLLAAAGGVDDPAKRGALRHTMTVVGRDGYRIVLSLGDLDPDFGAKPAIIAYGREPAEAEPLAGLRLVVPGDRHGGRNVRAVVDIEVR